MVLPAPVMPDPLLPIAIAPKSARDEESFLRAGRTEAEDLTVRVERNAETHQTVLWGMGENHIEVTLERLPQGMGSRSPRSRCCSPTRRRSRPRSRRWAGT